MIVRRISELDFRQLPGRLAADPLAGLSPEGVGVRVVRIDPGPRSPHRHPHSIEVIYVAEGRGRSWQDGLEEPVGPGDLLVIPARTPHATLADPDSALVLVCFFPHPDPPANTEELDAPILH